MAIQRKPKRNTESLDNTAAEVFISGATPQPAPTRTTKQPVALRFDKDLLDRIDATASKHGMSRNALISYYCSKGLDSDG